MSAIAITRWDEAAFGQAERPWEALVAQSDADPLFLGWDWQHLWWTTFARAPWAAARGVELTLLVAHDEDGALVGIAPLYRETSRVRGVLRVRRLQAIGNCWRGPGTVRTEYVDFIARRERKRDVVGAFLAHIEGLPGWDELVLPDLDTASETHRLLAAERVWPHAYVRVSERDASFAVDTTGSFEDYVTGLGKSTRRRLFHRRAALAAKGAVAVVPVAAAELDAGFEALNDLHRIRWGSAVFEGERLAFHRALAERMAACGALRLTRLSVDGRARSMLYDVRCGGREYNIQAGFDEAYDRKLPLGYLHLGYAIEAAFADPGVSAFDLLAGGGKNTQFKERLGAVRRDLVTLQLVRSGRLKMLYRLRDRWT